MPTAHTQTSAPANASAGATRVYLEQGKTWQFAAALDWPGWRRRGKGEQGALDVLLDYTDRYAAIADSHFQPGSLVVMGRAPGNRTTDFGAPDARGPWDQEPLTDQEAERQIELLHACWLAFDRAVALAPAELPKGPRGGGRDRDGIAAHVREAERAYAAKIDCRVAPRTPWQQQRAALTTALRQRAPSSTWPVRYALRRCAWHVLDHTWELQDKTD